MTDESTVEEYQARFVEGTERADLRAPAADGEVSPRERSPERAEQVRRFFTKAPEWVSPAGYFSAGFGAVAAAAAGAALGGLFAFGGAVCGFWLGWVGYRGRIRHRQYVRDYADAESKPGYEAMDRWLAEDLAYLGRHAARRIGLESDLPVQVVVGIPQGERGEAGDARDQLRVRVDWGTDGTLRASRYEVLHVFLTARTFAFHLAHLDFGTGRMVDETVRVCRYRDVVGVSSGFVSVPPDGAEGIEFITKTPAPITRAQIFAVETVGEGPGLRVLTNFGDVVKPVLDTAAGRRNDAALAFIQRAVSAARHGGE